MTMMEENFSRLADEFYKDFPEQKAKTTFVLGPRSREELAGLLERRAADNGLAPVNLEDKEAQYFIDHVSAGLGMYLPVLQKPEAGSSHARVRTQIICCSLQTSENLQGLFFGAETVPAARTTSAA